MRTSSRPLHGDDFIETKEHVKPLGTLTNLARIGCRHRIGAEPAQRVCCLSLLRGADDPARQTWAFLRTLIAEQRDNGFDEMRRHVHPCMDERSM